MKLQTTLILLLISTLSYGQFNQKTHERNHKEDQLKILEENSAKFKNGTGDFFRYLSKKLKFPKEAKPYKLDGTVKVKFTIGVDGKVKPESVEVVETTNQIFNDAAIKVIKSSPKWTPATDPDTKKTVEQTFVYPIFFAAKRG